MPSISSLSYNQGAETGSQFLDIAGTGFDQNAGQTQVLIGGQECSIVDGAITSTNIQCQTPAKSSDADPGYWMGSAGLKYELWQNNLDFDPGTQSIIGRPTVPLNPKTVARYKAKDEYKRRRFPGPDENCRSCLQIWFTCSILERSIRFDTSRYIA
mgnify:CR=1 FL=1